jgi:hypothetical protein
MRLWLQWWSVVAPLQQSCRDKRTFLWLCTTLAGFCTAGLARGQQYRGRCIFFSTDLTLSAVDIISSYGLRFRIARS